MGDDVHRSAETEHRGASQLDALIDGLADRGDHPIVSAFKASGAETWSYRRFGEAVGTLARGLRERTKAGEPVVLIGASGPEWMIVALAILRAGAVVTPLDVQLPDDTLEQVLEDADVQWIFTTEAQRERVRAAAPEARMALLDAAEEDENGWERLADGDAELPTNRSDDAAALFYTSGTTGPPKGVPLTHGNLAFQLDTIEAAGVARPGDRVLLPLPLHHVYPFVIGMLAPIHLGLTLVIPHALTGPQVIRAVHDGEVSVIIGVPRLYAAVLEGIVSKAESAGRLAGAVFGAALRLNRFVRRRLGLRLGKRLFSPLHRRVGVGLRVLASGGSALDPELAWDLEALGWQVAVGYGLTETAPLLTIDPPGRPRPGTVGRPVAGVELRIDREAAPAEGASAEEGEILARGPSVFGGYRNQPEKTAEAFTEDGWFRTGDLGRLDDDGYLHVTGRVSTRIVTGGGENIQPDDLEARYATHSAIQEIGVLQREGRLLGLIVPSGDIAADPEPALRAAVAAVGRKLASFQRLDDFAATRKPLPRTRLGKIQRHKLAERYERAEAEGGEPAQTAPLDPEEMSSEDRNLLEHPAAEAAWQWLAERYPKRGLSPDTRMQLELGMDSLAWLNLSIEIGQHTGVELDDEAIGRIETVRDLLRELVDAAEGDEAVSDPLEDPERVIDEAHRRWLAPRGPLLRAVAAALYAINWALLRGPFRLRVRNGRRLPAQGPLVLVCNHTSHLDPFAVAAALPLARLHTLYWGGWTGVAFTNAASRFVSRAAQIIPIDPQKGVRTSLALAAAVLERERGLIWFPEGQRSRDGELQSFRPGIGMLLARFPVPVVLATIQGTHQAMPPGRRLPRLHRLTVRFGPTLDPRELAGEGDSEDAAARIVGALERRLREQLPQSSSD